MPPSVNKISYRCSVLKTNVTVVCSPYLIGHRCSWRSYRVVTPTYIQWIPSHLC